MHYLLSAFIFVWLVNNQCPGFYIEGYLDLFYEEKKGTIFCAVVCDIAKQYYPAELDDRQASVNYVTIYKKSSRDTSYKSAFEGTSIDLNCQYGCLNILDLNEPYHLISTQMTVVSTNPVRYYRATVECKPGYFSNMEIESFESDVKIFMKCTRKASDAADSWSWTTGVVQKLHCILGCARFGMNAPVHQNTFGAVSVCKHVGKPKAGLYDTVSTCNIYCDVDNGYFPILETDEYMRCPGPGANLEKRIYFVCDQGCVFDEKAEKMLAAKNLEGNCTSPIASSQWYSRCTVGCTEGVAVIKRGDFGDVDILDCRLGRWNVEVLSLVCG